MRRTTITSPPTTHVIMITDQSGSMAPLADDVRNGFNGYLDELRDSDARIRVTVNLFNIVQRQLCMDAPLVDTPRLTTRNYLPSGGTALYDAIGRTISRFDEGPRDRVLCVIQTDGAENSSIMYSVRQVRDLIRAKEATGRWTFIFLGAGLAAWQEGRNLGLRDDQLLRTAATSRDINVTYDSLATATRSYAAGASGAEVSDLVMGALESGNATNDTP